MKSKKFYFSQASLANLTGVDRDIVEVCKLAISITNIDFGIPGDGGFRTTTEQQMLFSKGKSQLDGVNKRSNHQDGRAVDVFAWVDGKVSYEEEHMALVACAMLEAASRLKVRIKWGGHWTSFRDTPHFEKA